MKYTSRFLCAALSSRAPEEREFYRHSPTYGNGSRSSTAITGRIDINDQGIGCRQELCVSRTMPATLKKRISQTVWNNFCDEVDEALQPVNDGKQRLSTAMMIYVAFEVIMIILSFALFFASFNDSCSSHSHSCSSRSRFTSFIPSIIAVLSFFVIIPATWYWASNFANEGLDNLRKVCEEATVMNPGISFHVREEHHLHTHGDSVSTATTNFIEVYISDDTTVCTLLPTEMQLTPVVKATAIGPETTSSPAFNPAAVAAQPEPEFDIESGISDKKSLADRMAALKEVKDLLTEEEYLKKRTEILSQI